MSLDYSKVDNFRLEGLATQGNKRDEAQIKKAGFDFRMMRLDESIKNAKNDKELKKFQEIRKKTLAIFNKYNNSSFKS